MSYSDTENELELAQQWGLLDQRSDSSPVSSPPGSRDRLDSSRGSRDTSGYGSTAKLTEPKSYTGCITKDEFCQIVVTMCEKLRGRNIGSADVRFSEEDVPGYYYKAYKAGIINGTGITTGGKVILGRDEKLTREQISKMLYQAIVYCFPEEAACTQNAGACLSVFSDQHQISDWALASAAYMTENGIIKGVNGKFLPGEQCTFEQGVILAKRVYESFQSDRILAAAPMRKSGLSAPVMLSPRSNSASVEDGVKLQWQEMKGADRYLVKIDYPGEAQTQRTYTGDTEIEIKGDGSRNLNPGQMSVSIAAVDKSGNVISPFVRVGTRLYDNPDNYHGNSDYYFDFKDSTEAAKYMKTVTITVWDFDSSGKKVTRTKCLTVHNYVADEVIAIFEKIYNGPEKFPIHSVSGYRPGTRGEHPKGTAIDINPNENYEVFNDGRTGTGSFWKPGENPYSIPLNGDVVKAFRSYGWGWGGTDWRSKKDYMHFSYFGT